jgi:hypothetical protein
MTAATGHPQPVQAFPFAGVGGLVAVALLVVTYAIFAGLVRLLGAAASGLRLTVVPGIVDGIRDWALPEGQATAAGTPEVAPPWEDLPPGGVQVGDE